MDKFNKFCLKPAFMRKIPLLIAALAMLVLLACRSKSAFNFSQEIVKKEQSLIPDMQRTEDKVASYIKANTYDSITVAADFMEKEIDKKLTEIKTMPAPDAKLGQDFKNQSIEYFSYLKSIYSKYKDLGQAPTEEARTEVLQSMQELLEKREVTLRNMQRTQKAFAQANGFNIK